MKHIDRKSFSHVQPVVGVNSGKQCPNLMAVRFAAKVVAPNISGSHV